MTAALVSGALANKPRNGGEAWVRLTWALGLRRLGIDVTLVEQIAPEACVDQAGAPAGFGESQNRRFFEQVTQELGLGRDSCLIDAGSGETAGLPYEEVQSRAREADLLLNLSGHLRIAELVAAPRLRAYVDLDPGFTQFWAIDGIGDLGLDSHERHLTVGHNLGAPGCEIPDAGFEWLPVRPPVLTESWPAVAAPAPPLRFTTVASWRGPYGPIEHRGRRFALKHHEFRRLLELPGRCDAEFELALAIGPADDADTRALRAAGWRLVEPAIVAPDPRSFRDYVQASGAEFSAAQGVYVETASGWCSDRTACYLATGRPALVQDTGLGPELTADGGLVTFRTLDEAVAGAERIAADYERHSRAARSLAQRCFDSDRVLPGVLERLGIGG